MAKSISTTAARNPISGFSYIKKHSRGIFLLAIIVLLALAGTTAYLIRAHQADVASAEPAPQTATVRLGSLIISASGSGTLVPSDEKELAFSSDGQVTDVFVKPGDYVVAGTTLARIDSQQAQIDFTSAERSYQELTSETAIAAAQQQVAQAQSDLMSAKYQLEYLISPEVLYWETEIAKGEETLKEAKASAQASPSNQDAQDALTKARDFLGFANDKLDDAWELYDDEYVPETFRLIEDGNDKDVYAVPTDMEIHLARTKIDEAQTALNDAQEYYAVLTGAPIPENANSQALIDLQQAERNLRDAQIALEGTKILAPISGTILSVDASAGNMVDTGTVITMADLSQLELEFYMDESDWNLVTEGSQAEVTFDALPDQTFSGQVTHVDTELYVSNNSSAVKGVVQLDSTNGQLEIPIGTSAAVDIIQAQVENAVLVPIEALHETSPGKYVVFLLENGTLIQHAVEIGLQDQIYAEVKSGLNAGDVVSTEPLGQN